MAEYSAVNSVGSLATPMATKDVMMESNLVELRASSKDETTVESKCVMWVVSKDVMSGE